MKINNKTKAALASAKNAQSGKGKNAGSAKQAKQAASGKGKLVSVAQVYRAFKSIDGSAYRAQGEASICCLRKGDKVLVAEMGSVERGTTVWIVKGQLGYGAMIGKVVTVDGKRCLQAGTFALAHGAYVIAELANWGAVTAWLARHGQKAKVDGKLDGKVAIGIDANYGLASDGKRAFRLESDTCERGKAWFYSLN